MRKCLRIVSGIGLSVFVAVIALLVCVVIVACIMHSNADMLQPDDVIDKSSYQLDIHNDSLRVCGTNSIYMNNSGLWEVVLRGDALHRGASYGAMAEDLLYYQEQVFVEQIHRLVPSDDYLSFLRFFLEIFNRHMADHVPVEFRKEIYAMAEFCSHQFDVFGTPYERQMHYHAAHDIGHMMQGFMLVGCSSCASWGECTDDGRLIVGRNFDFWMGDDFAKNRQVVFAFPEKGYKYASVSWPGMTGVVSGMNEKGLTVTLNASTGMIPTASAMPVAMLAKQILMYAENIQQAYEIASENLTFVSESFLVSSAADMRAVVIEKTPEAIGLYSPDGDNVVCTNHFQSDRLAMNEDNILNISSTDSKYRYDRMSELIGKMRPLDRDDVVSVLRDRAGLGGKDIGLANSMALNQSIANHSVVFEPQELKMWVSTNPWQSGEFLCYDLKSVFSLDGVVQGSLASENLKIAADSVYIRNVYPDILAYRSMSAVIRNAVSGKDTIDDGVLDNFLKLNPQFYETYSLTGDYYEMCKEFDLAVKYWKTALEKELPGVDYRNELMKKIHRYDKK